MSISRSGVSSSASASASARTSRPSASVLPISTVMPLRERIDVERPERRAGHRILHRRESARAATPSACASMIMCASASTARRAAHVLLHQQHGAVGLDVEPAGIEAHALADQRDLRVLGIAPAHIDQPRRRARGAADGVDQRKILLQQIVADDRLRSWRRAARRDRATASSSSAGPMSLAGVLMRSRASVTPSAMRESSAASTPSGMYQLDCLVLGLAVAGESGSRRARKQARRGAASCGALAKR